MPAPIGQRVSHQLYIYSHANTHILATPARLTLAFMAFVAFDHLVCPTYVIYGMR